MIHKWSPYWETQKGKNLVYPNFYNEIRFAEIEREHVQPNNFIDYDWAYTIEETQFIDRLWFEDGFESGINLSNAVSFNVSGFENLNTATTPPTAWTRAVIVGELDQTTWLNNPWLNPQIGADFGYQMYQAINLKLKAVTDLNPFSDYIITSTIPVEPDLVVDNAIWNVYTTASSITIGGVPYAVPGSYEMWAGDKNKQIKRSGGFEYLTGRADTLRINLIASAFNYAIADFSGEFKYKDV